MKGSLKASLEALLFASHHPLSIDAAAEAMDLDKQTIKDALGEMIQDFESSERGVHLVEVAGGWQILTRPEQAPYVEKLLIGRRRARLSRASLETLAAIAYNQPITRGEIDTLRGVDSSGALRTILERDLVAVKGKSDRIGRPLIYGTTATFLEYFGLPSINDLPQLEDFAALVDRDAVEEEVSSAEAGDAAAQEASHDEDAEAPEIENDDEAVELEAGLEALDFEEEVQESPPPSP
ncbi:MAG: SMC-Scp complex subunit ScpB [Candidatus Eisenbacteria bacterium]|uniref:SMC-Scp complex subunit ScpB n=1 Tax=Eiseniibacteriota bacterium TaxID=2212470 RepID=A0A948RUF7_UNCEI|nr:SMC-Scp complex subunit ScpB [Candidatus Eisenbacteria bacterium]MBU1947162.1 SMC-Scp complex subunit ScpB [Candidatus Eisenbacteria bacterium]MBU2691218.1 SMC-Scp complex subunit ScpB [Candidatus Eisenbacteria bacterium]